MSASYPEMHISHLPGHIAAQCQRLYLFFESSNPVKLMAIIHLQPNRQLSMQYGSLETGNTYILALSIQIRLQRDSNSYTYVFGIQLLKETSGNDI